MTVTLTGFALPGDAECVEDELISERQSATIDDNLVSVIHDRVPENTPSLMTDDAATMFASRLCMIAVGMKKNR